MKKKLKMARIHKVCVITEGSSGLGFETSKKTAALGYEVVLACRNKTNAKLAITRIERDSPDAKLVYMPLDLSSLSSIEKFSRSFHDSGKKLNVLINTAEWKDKESSRVATLTENGFEKTFAVNYLGHFLLTFLLLDVLKSTAKFDLEARIVVLSSAIAKQVRKNAHALDVNDIQLVKSGSYTGRAAYHNSQIIIIAFCQKLHRSLEGSGVTCNVVNPGKYVRPTSLSPNLNCFRKHIFPCFCQCSRAKIANAARAVVFLAADGELRRVRGRCFVGCEEIFTQVETQDLDFAKKLWELSKSMVSNVL